MSKRTTQKSEERKLNGVIQILIAAIEERNKRSILNAYELAKDIDLEKVSDSIFDTYDKLVEKGNNVLTD